MDVEFLDPLLGCHAHTPTRRKPSGSSSGRRIVRATALDPAVLGLTEVPRAGTLAQSHDHVFVAGVVLDEESEVVRDAYVTLLGETPGRADRIVELDVSHGAEVLREAGAIAPALAATRWGDHGV